MDDRARDQNEEKKSKDTQKIELLHCTFEAKVASIFVQAIWHSPEQIYTKAD